MKKKLLSILLAAAMISSMLAGCGAAGSSASVSTSKDAAVTTGGIASSQETKSSGTATTDTGNDLTQGNIKAGGTLRIGTTQNPSVIGYTPELKNNSFIQYLRCAYDSLTSYDKDGKIVGDLAESWDVDSDNATITFHLLKGVKFSDGTDFNAEAVKRNIEQYKETGRSETNDIKSVDVVDDTTVKISFTKWNSSSLEMVGFFIYYMSPTAFEKNGADWLRKNSCGTGPFVVSAFDQGVSVSYKKNENYRVSGEPYLDGITYTIFADATTLENAFKASEIDVITYGNDCDLMNDLSTMQGITIDKNTNGLGVESVGLIPSSADKSDPFYDANVRKALCYAVDWDTIVSSLSYGLYQRTNQWAAPGAVTYNTKLVGYTYNPEKAKELLKQAGYEKGFETTLYTFSNGFYQNAATAISANLAEVGITAKIEVIDAAKSADMMANGWKGLFWHWASIGPDLGLYMGRHLDVNGAYYAKGIQHPQDCLDLLDQIRSAKDDKTKVDLEWQLQEKIYDEYALFGEPLYVNAPCHIRYDYVKGGQFALVDAIMWSPATTWMDK